MEKLPKTFNMGDIDGIIESSVDVLYNFTAANSVDAQLMFCDDKVYLLFPQDTMGAAICTPMSFGYDDVAGTSKFLFKFRIHLKDGTKLEFSNIGGKKREMILAALETHK